MKKYIWYEVKNNLGNIMSIIFGLIFPTVMTNLFFYVFKSQLSASESIVKFGTQLFLVNLLMAPLALVLVGFTATFSQEIEQGMTLRLSLFGYSHKKQILAKLVSQFFVVIFAIGIYCACSLITIPVLTPSPTVLFIYILCMVLLVVLFFLFAYAISMLTKKFSGAFGISMSFYFVVMILSGMMGIQPDQFPSGVRYISNLLPTTQIALLFPKVWDMQIQNPAPLIQSFLFLSALCGVLLLPVFLKNKRHV